METVVIFVLQDSDIWRMHRTPREFAAPYVELKHSLPGAGLACLQGPVPMVATSLVARCSHISTLSRVQLPLIQCLHYLQTIADGEERRRNCFGKISLGRDLPLRYSRPRST